MASERTVRVVPDVAGLEAEFDYRVPEKLDRQVHVGTIVRVDLHGRRVRAWVVDEDSTPPEGVRLLDVQRVSGEGPTKELIELAGWAAWRWAGKRSFFLQTASPPRNVPRVDGPPSTAPAVPRSGYFIEDSAVLRWPPAADPLTLALAATEMGPALVITPTVRGAERLVDRLRRNGVRAVLHPDGWAEAARGGVTVVGSRAAAWAPMPDLRAVLVLDAHDASLQSEASPTWNAVDVAIERARRRNIPCLLASPVPRSEHLEGRTLLTVDRSGERGGWAPVHVVDLRHTDPRSGMYSPPLVELLRSERRVVCILNRKGRAQLLVCSACDEVARCEKCMGNVAAVGSALVCRRCGVERPVVCSHCGSSRLKQLRVGVGRAREELEALANRPVGEVTSESHDLPDAPVLVGTEALLYRVGRAGAVAFLDFDQELMAPRFRASEDALALLARASRLAGGRNGDGVVLVQSRQPDHAVIDAAVHADPGRLAAVERATRAEMGWPPFSALAAVSGPGAADLVNSLPLGVNVAGRVDDRWLLRSPEVAVLADALTQGRRRGNRIRIEVDPPRI